MRYIETLIVLACILTSIGLASVSASAESGANANGVNSVDPDQAYQAIREQQARTGLRDSRGRLTDRMSDEQRESAGKKLKLLTRKLEGDKAELTYKAFADNDPMLVDVTLSKEGGIWKVRNERIQHDHQSPQELTSQKQKAADKKYADAQLQIQVANQPFVSEKMHGIIFSKPFAPTIVQSVASSDPESGGCRNHIILIDSNSSTTVEFDIRALPRATEIQAAKLPNRKGLAVTFKASASDAGSSRSQVSGFGFGFKIAIGKPNGPNNGKLPVNIIFQTADGNRLRGVIHCDFSQQK